MDTTLLASIIGGVCTLAAALLGKIGFFDQAFKGNKTTNLQGKWDSSWIDLDDKTQTLQREDFYITKQKGSKIAGYIIKSDEPDKKWDFEGNFSGRFLQINYYPSKDAENRLFLDYGCYFFDMLGDHFNGYSVGYYWNDNQISLSKHQLKKIR